MDCSLVTYQAPPSMGFSRQECWSGLPLPSPGDPSDPGIEPGSPALQTGALPSEPPGKPPVCSRSAVKTKDVEDERTWPHRELPAASNQAHGLPH